MATFFQLDLVEWVEKGFSTNWGFSNHEDWISIFFIACWKFWNWRNQKIYEYPYKRPSVGHIIIQEFASEVGKAISKQSLGSNLNACYVTYIKWHPPPEGWVKVNTDGATKNNPDKAGCGGLIRNSDGKWVMGFTRNLGACSAYMAELWGLCLGLEMAWTLGFKRVKVELDSQAVISSVIQIKDSIDAGSVLYCRIKELMGRNWMIHLVHIYREANACADWLANYSLQQNCSTHYWNSPPTGIRSLLFGDESGVPHPRTVAVV